MSDMALSVRLEVHRYRSSVVAVPPELVSPCPRAVAGAPAAYAPASATSPTSTGWGCVWSLSATTPRRSLLNSLARIPFPPDPDAHLLGCSDRGREFAGVTESRRGSGPSPPSAGRNAWRRPRSRSALSVPVHGGRGSRRPSG